MRTYVSAVVSSLILMVMTSMSWSNTLMNIFTSFFILEINLQSKHVWQLLNSTCLLHLLQELMTSPELTVMLYLLSGELLQLKEELSKLPVVL